MRRAATNGSDALPITSIAGSLLRMSVRVWRTDAESSTMRTRILLRMRHLDSLKERGAGDPERQRKAGERLGVAEEEIAAGPQMVAKLAQHGLLGRLVEIDQDIAAEDHVHVAVDAIGGLHQIAPTEAHQATPPTRDPHHIAVPTLPPLHMPLP